MVEQDTVKLLRECDAGVKMGVSSIEDVLDNVRSREVKRILETCKAEHDKLETEIRGLLESTTTTEKIPTPWPRGCPG